MYNSLLLSLERTSDLDWCCLVLDKHSDMIPSKNWGSFNSSNGLSEWNQKDCNNLVVSFEFYRIARLLQC